MLGDFNLVKGSPDSPVVILIHGLGMNRHFWADPALCPAVAGMASVTIFLNEAPPMREPGRFTLGLPKPSIPSLHDKLTRSGFSVISWSQKRPFGPVLDAIDELTTVVARAMDTFGDLPVYLVGHSRGGLIARKYLSAHRRGPVQKLVTLGTPHRGTRMASIGKQLGSAAPLLQRLLPEHAQSNLTKALQQAAGFFGSKALVELMPDSDFIRSLDPAPQAHIPALTVAGTNPDLLSLYMRPGVNTEWKRVSLPGFLFNALPSERRPGEVRRGFGDGLVSEESSRLPGARHISLPLNHVALAFDERLQDEIVDFLLTN